MEIRGRRGEWPTAGLRAITLMVGLVLLITACSRPGAGQPESRHQLAAQRLLAYAHCMQTHGVPGYPEPKITANGISESTRRGQVDPNSPQYRSAAAACQRLRPGAGAGNSPADQAQARAEGLRYSRCMRAHGVPEFPDPDAEGVIDVSAEIADSPEYQRATSYCQSHGYSAGISVQGGS
jgi:hypothetical protein